MMLSPETELLLLCARPRLDEAVAHRIRSLVQGAPDWHFIVGLAEAHRVAPLLSIHLQEYAADLLSEDVRAALQAQHRDTTRHNLVLAVELLRLTGLLQTQGIEAVPFKGPVSALLVYGDMAMRACGDIDLLVRPGNHGRAQQLLEAEGYVVQHRYPDAMQSSLWHAQRQISIDLHWGMPPAILDLRSDRLWEALEPVTLLGRSVPTFSPCDTLLVTAINATKEYWKPSLHHLSDIAALTERYTHAEWVTAVRRARRIGCHRMLLAALLLTHRLLGIALPAAIPARLFEQTAISNVVEELLAHLLPTPDEEDLAARMKPVHHRRSQTYYLSLTDSPWRRVRDWLAWAFTPTAADRMFVSLPKGLLFLHYVVRPLRLLIKRS